MSTSEASSSMKQLVEKVKKTKNRSSGSKKSSRSSGSKKASRSSGSKKSHKNSKSSTSSELSETGEPFYKTLMNKFNSNRMLWCGVVVALMVVIWYYVKNKKKKENTDEQVVNLLNNENNEENKQIETKPNLNVDEQVRKAFMERDEHDRKNNIVRLKLPDKYMTDDDGRPVILTPEVIENIQKHAQEQNKQKNTKKRKQKVNVSDDEPENIKSQDLSNTEMEEIREQLDLMDSTNTIMPSNN
jgi:hypothetical protein